MSAAVATLSASAPGQSAAAPPSGTPASKDDGGFFSDLLDIINPLQHLPVISTIYRAVTGDQIGDAEQVAGDTLYGGLIGLGSSLLNLAFRDATGKNIGDTVLAFAEDVTGIHIGGNSTQDTPGATALALNQPLASTSPLAALAQASLPSLDAQTATPAAVRPAQASTMPNLPDSSALLSALNAKGIDPALAMRALAAYGKSLGLGAPR